tara:strand:- start:1738 stop:2358 length:621 start_codon:yes stop_codon:yes gene_type:complete
MGNMRRALKNVYSILTGKNISSFSEWWNYMDMKKLQPGFKQMVLAEYGDNGLGKQSKYFDEDLPKEVLNILLAKYRGLGSKNSHLEVHDCFSRCGISPFSDNLGKHYIVHQKNYIETNWYDSRPLRINNHINQNGLYRQKRGLINVYTREELMEHCKKLGINSLNRKNFKRSKKNQYIDWILEKNDWKIKDQTLIGWELDSSYIRT